MVGSSNFDMRSFHLNLEVSLVSYDPAIIEALRAAEEDYIARSLPLLADVWPLRPASVRLFENLIRLTSALQ